MRPEVLDEELRVKFFCPKTKNQFCNNRFFLLDGGANLHMAWSTPGSHEQLSVMSSSSSGNPSLSSGTTTQALEHNQQPAMDELSAVARLILIIDY